MAKKISTIILNVDLDCRLCNKKIKKTLAKFPEIQSQSFDHKKNTVTISGPFDPEKLSKCLSCRAGKSLKGFQIVKPGDTKPDKPPADGAKPQKADDAPKKAESPKKEAAPPKKPDSPKKVDSKPEPVPVPVPVPVPAAEPVGVPVPIPVVVKPAPEQVIPPPQPIRHPAWPPCACGGVSYEGYGAGPCSSGWPIHGGGCNTFFSEEDTTCKTM